jgi:DNA-binding IclR family transcriptional regulator
MSAGFETGAGRGRPRKRIEDDAEIKRGISALDHALTVLKALAGLNAPATLSDIARSAGMPATKAHRYLASFIAAGLVRQPERSGRYDLGKGAMELGLAAIARNNVVNRVADSLAELTETTGCTAMLSIWGNQGPTVVRWERSATFIVTTLGLGTTFPLLNSATGQVFLANLPDRLTSPLLEREMAARTDLSPEEVETLRAKIRTHGFSSVAGRWIPGLQAASAPVLNWQNEIECAVTLIDTGPRVVDADGGVLPALRDFCRRFSIPKLKG